MRKKEIAGFSFDREPPEYSSAEDIAAAAAFVEAAVLEASVAEAAVLESLVAEAVVLDAAGPVPSNAEVSGLAVVALEAATVLDACRLDTEAEAAVCGGASCANGRVSRSAPGDAALLPHGLKELTQLLTT